MGNYVSRKSSSYIWKNSVFVVSSTTKKMNILVLGGCGFIGRHLVMYLIDEKIDIAKLRFVDKNMVETSWFSPEQKAKVKGGAEFVQANLANEPGRKKAFGDISWDYVFNCAGESRLGQDLPVYEERVRDLSVACAKASAAINVKGFVELSSARAYASSKSPVDENGKISPWTSIASLKYQAEEQIRAIPNLNYTILRPAVVYGVNDLLGIMPRVVIGAVYKIKGEKMKLLWTEKLGISTVHVSDVVRAIWLARDSAGETFNLADSANSTQDTITSLVAEIFGIKHGYFGQIISSTASMASAASLCSMVNDQHMQPWSDVCQKDNIQNSPLSPYLNEELLKNNNLNIDGSKITKSLDFTYNHPKPTKELVMEAIQAYVDIGAFPKSVL